MTHQKFPTFPLDLAAWSFPTYFDPPNPPTLHPIIDAANKYQAEAKVELHPFFSSAVSNPEALRVWASQEAIVTNTFSQLLLFVSSQIKNVHLRAAFMQVITGEHHNLKGGVAIHSHPWLLRRLCQSMSIDLNLIKPLRCTLNFLDTLSTSTEDLFKSLGTLGVGNERMLIPEYTAVKKCFDTAWPNADYIDFLDANIFEDEAHTQIIEQVASSLISSEEDAKLYYEGAVTGVDARMSYYDNLHLLTGNDSRQ